MWLSLGWLAEGVLLIAYGVLRDVKPFKQAGFAISALCLFAFILIDCARPDHGLFAYKYLAVTLGSLIVLGAYMYKKMAARAFARVYKYFALANAWVYTLYVIGKLEDVLWRLYRDQAAVYRVDYLMAAAVVVATFCFAYVIPRIKPLFEPGLKILSAVFYVTGLLALFYLNAVNTPVPPEYLRASAPAFGVTLYDDAPIRVGGVTVRYYADEVVFEGRAGEAYTLEFGADPAKTAPVYDIARYRDEVLKGAIGRAELGPVRYAEADAAPAPRERDDTLLFNIVVIAVTLLLGTVILLKLKQMS
jgi:hypothetical protein